MMTYTPSTSSSILLILFFIFNMTNWSLGQDEDDCLFNGPTVSINSFDSNASNKCTSDGQFSVDVFGGIEPLTYLWSNGDTTSSIDSLTPWQTYSITVTDRNGCTDEDARFVGVEPSPSVGFRSIVNGPTVEFIENVDLGENNEIVSRNWTIDGAPKLPQFEHIFQEAGIHPVCLEITDKCGDTHSNCSLIITKVTPDEAFTFTLGKAEGRSGDTIPVPVSIRNFDRILGFQKSIRLADSSVGKIVDVHGFGLDNLSDNNFEKINDTLWTCAWFQQSATDLQADSVIYYIDVLLTIDEGKCTILTFDGTSIPLEVVQERADGIPEQITPWIKREQACVFTAITLGGQIHTPYNQPVPDVTIACTSAEEVQTDVNGQYTVTDLLSSLNYVLTPSKDTVSLQNVTTLDLIYLLRHILNRQQLLSPHKLIMGDVNLDRTISIVDIIIIQQLILGKIDHFPNTASWRFIPADYTFPDIEQPNSANFPTSITALNVVEDNLENDFIGVEMGDVSWIENISGFQHSPNQRSNQRNVDPVHFFNHEIEGQPGDTLNIPIRVRNFNDILGFQKSIHFSKENFGRIIGISGYGLPDLSASNFNIIGDSLVTASWFQSDALSLADSTTIYTIEVVVPKKAFPECNLLVFDNTLTPMQVIGKDLTIINYETQLEDLCIQPLTIICEDEDLILSDDITPDNYQAHKTITSTGNIQLGDTTVFRAGKCIVLQPGFQTVIGSNFQAIIGNCTPSMIEEVIPTEPVVGSKQVPFIPLSYSTKQSNTINVYPNPFSHTMTIDYRLSTEGTVQLILFDIMGRKVKELENSYKITGNYTTSLQAKYLEDGIYFLRVQLGNEFWVKKLYLQKTSTFGNLFLSLNSRTIIS